VDIEYLFLHIRSKSVGGICEPILNLKDENGKTHEQKLKIPISSIQVTNNPEHNRDIQITDDLILRMRYPEFGMKIENEGDSDTQNMFNTIIECVDEIFQGEDSWHHDSLNDSDIGKFIESMTQDQLNQVMSFFKTMPKLEKEIKVTVGKKEHTITLSGLNDFFGSPSHTITS